ncbi:MAG: MBL fold metallo-hydrolase [Betaproteobacteria bacterium]|nr:MBL fold metallo-hydrolase [Betaproteobacteria bacterium]
MQIRFHGAAGEVTGSCFEVITSGCRFLVDCGMFQGGREADRKNRDALGFDVRDIDFVLLTHAHIDHSGLLPRLSMLRYHGPIYCTAATADLLEVMLPDSAHIQEKEVEWETRHRRREGRHSQQERAPLYTVTQAIEALKRLRKVEYDEDVQPHDKVRVRYRDAGHILGSAYLEVWVEEGGTRTKVVFSGDLGQPGHPLMRDPEPVEETDVLVMESTYGNRLHRPMLETLDELASAVTETIAARQGNVIIPAFAVGRTQDVIYLLLQLYREGRVPDMHIYVDSPMALAATQITMRHLSDLDPEATRTMAWLRGSGGKPAVHFVQDVEESIELNQVRSGAVIISASGMCDAGRIKYHLRHNLPRKECSVVIVGFQAGGTLGRRLVDGAKNVRIFGDQIPVRARIHTIGGLSAHADQAALLGWLRGLKRPPGRLFLVHGERSIRQTFAETITRELGWPEPTLPEIGDTFDA